MPDFAIVLLGGLLMSAIASIGAVSLLWRASTLEPWLLPMVAMAAGSLIAGAFFHMLPAALPTLSWFATASWLVGGFASFLAIEQFLHWHHSHHAGRRRREPVTYLILLGDGVHNFVGGLGVASTFLIDARAGAVAWLAAVAHEIPQELGDFGVLVHGGWSRRRALFWNVMSASTFPLGAMLAYFASRSFDVAPLVAFAAGNFLYIAASDLIPEIKSVDRLRDAAVHFGCFVTGALVVAAVGLIE